MGYVYVLLLIVAGVLALSGLIIAKKPDAKAIIDKLVPFQAFIGVGLLALAILYLLMGGLATIRLVGVAPVYAIAAIAAIASGVILGALFGMPQIAKWIPGESSAETKAMELSQKAAPYQALVGVIAIGSAVVVLLYASGLIKFTAVVGLNG